MQKRRPMSRGKSKKLFRKTADRGHMFNKGRPGLKRGGIRL